MSQAATANTILSDYWSRELSSSVNARPASPGVVMTALLQVMGVDLGDEREVIRILIGAKFSGDQVKSFMDEAVALAQ